MDTELILKTAAEAVQVEIDGLLYLKEHLGKEFAELVRLCIKILDNGGKIVVCGIGKSGHVGISGRLARLEHIRDGVILAAADSGVLGTVLEILSQKAAAVAE